MVTDKALVPHIPPIDPAIRPFLCKVNTFTLDRLISLCPAIPQPAQFDIVPIDGTGFTLVVTGNEKARDAMGQAFKTTRSMIATPEVLKTLLRTTARPEFGRCGAKFTEFPMFIYI